MNYDETVELEQHVKIKNKAEATYADFLAYIKLSPKEYKDGRFRCWHDRHNATYFKVIGDVFVFQCRFLHETYNVTVTPSGLFDAIQSGNRGYAHLVSKIHTAKTRKKG